MLNQTMRHCTGCMTKIEDDGQCSNPECRWDEANQPEMQEHLPRHYVLLGRYYIGRVLGQGGFGVTYIAQDLKLDRVVAIKEYLPNSLCSRRTDRATVHSYSADKSEQFQYGKERFLIEAQNMAKLGGHPNLVSITDYMEANGTAYMAMEFISGLTLRQYLQGHGGTMPYTVASGLMLHVMSGLRRMHEQGFVHRDVSPDNIMISKEGPIKLIDFGAARQAVGERSQSLSVILKPGYAPEEQYRTRGVQGPYTDVYAAAATLYRCITGQIPPASPDRMAGDAELVRPSTLCEGLPPAAEAAILKGLAVRASDRFQTITDFQQALVQKLDVPPPPPLQVTADPVPQPRPPIVPQAPPLVLYNSTAVWNAAFFGTALAGCILMAINYKRLKNLGAAWMAVLIGTVVTTAAMLWAYLGPSGGAWQSVDIGLGIGVLFAVSATARQLQGKAVEENLARGGRRGSYWAAMGVGLLTLAAVVGVAVLIVLGQQAMRSSVTIGANDKVFYAGSATEQDARSLGEALKTSGYFSDKGVEVDLDKSGGTTTISFVVKDGTENDQKMLDAFQVEGRQIASSVGGLPISIRLTNTTHDVKYQTTLQVLDAPISLGLPAAAPAPQSNSDSKQDAAPSTGDDVGHSFPVGKGSLSYYDSITEAQAREFAKHVWAAIQKPEDKVEIGQEGTATRVDFVLGGSNTYWKGLAEETAAQRLLIGQSVGGDAFLVVNRLPVVVDAVDTSGKIVYREPLKNALVVTVTDTTGAAISKANVSFLGSDGYKQEETTYDSGKAALAGLAAGTYTVEVKATGFKTYRSTDFELAETGGFNLDVQMQVGQDVQ